MRIVDIIGESAGAGKIVKGINTTPDVHPGEIKRQARKMSLNVDNNGRPPIANPNGSDSVKEEIWNEKNPKKHHSHLTSSQKSAAKARAKKAGRTYPNLVDNMWAIKK